MKSKLGRTFKKIMKGRAKTDIYRLEGGRRNKREGKRRKSTREIYVIKVRRDMRRGNKKGYLEEEKKEDYKKSKKEKGVYLCSYREKDDEIKIGTCE